MALKSLTILGHRPFVNGFFKKFPQYLQYKTFSPKPFTDLIRAFHHDLVDAVIDSRGGVDLPLKMGNIKIISFKSRGYLNFGNYKKGEGFISNFTNNHTDGLTGKIFYTNHHVKYRLKDKVMWSFEPEAPFKLKVSKAFSLNYQNYIFSPNRVRIAVANSDFNMKSATNDKIKKFLETYNEFYLN